MVNRAARGAHVDTHRDTRLWPAAGAIAAEMAVAHRVPAGDAPRSHAHGPTEVLVSILATTVARVMGWTTSDGTTP